MREKRSLKDEFIRSNMRLIGFQKQKRNGGKEIIKEIIRKSLITEGHECPDWQNLLNAQQNVGKKKQNQSYYGTSS